MITKEQKEYNKKLKMKTYKFNLKPIILEAENEKEAWEKFERAKWIAECNDMEETEK
jgi:hypothetical protein